MKLFTFLTVVGTVVTATTAIVNPSSLLLPRANNGYFNYTDVQALAIYVENLEIALYTTALTKFSKQDFHNAGFDDFYYQTLLDILHEHEATANFLDFGISTFDGTPDPNIKPCVYSFPFTDVKSFVNLAALLESFAASTYLGVAYFDLLGPDAHYHTNISKVVTPAAIAATNGKHVAFHKLSLRQNITEQAYVPMLGLNVSYTYARSYAKSCPSGGYPIPFTLLPSLTPNVTQVRPDEPVDFQSSYTWNPSNPPRGLFVWGTSAEPADIYPAKDGKPGHFYTFIPDKRVNVAGVVWFYIVSDEYGTTDGRLAVTGPVAFQVIR